jgi:formylglycine-generating enzyme required for sulfatase activity
MVFSRFSKLGISVVFAAQLGLGGCGTLSGPGGDTEEDSGTETETSTTCAATQASNSDKSDTGSIAGAVGDKVSVACGPGYEGGGDWTCDEDGAFVGTTCTDIDECAGVTCGNGGTCAEADGETVANQYTCTCATGYSGGISIGCTPDNCTVAGLTTPTNGSLNTTCADASALNHGTSCDLACDSGYTLSGTQPSCTTGVFSAGGIGCTPDNCTVAGLTTPTNGNLNSTCADASALTHGVSCDLACDPGHTLGGTQPSCTTGEFSTGSISCTPNNCTVAGVLQLPNGNLNSTCADTSALNHGTSCDLACDSGHTLSGTQPSCTAGVFSAGSIGCTPNNCTVAGLTTPTNGNLNTTCADTSALNHGAACDLACDPGYTKSGNQPSCTTGTFSTGSISCTPDGMVLIPVGTFWMGCNGTAETCSTPSRELPYHLVTLDAFYMDITEVTAAAYTACVDEGVCTYAGPTADDPARTYNNAKDDHPINYVDSVQASEYCTWKGKSLPTEAQWEKAARGGCDIWTTDCESDTPIYPWNNDAPMSNHAVISVTSTAVVGSKPDGDSPYGLKDMAGNVWEWTADEFAGGYYCEGNDTTDSDATCNATDVAHETVTDNPTGPTMVFSRRSIRGGSFDGSFTGLRSSGRGFGGSTSSFLNVGFRCAQ